MSIKVTCSCGMKLRAKDEAAGKRARCPACGKITLLPGSCADQPAVIHEDMNAIATHIPPEITSSDSPPDFHPLS